MRLAVALATACTLAPAFAPSLAAQEAYAGRPIGSVEVFVERRPSQEPALVEVIETRPGDMLLLARVRESITHLYSLGRFQDIQVDAVEAGGRITLRYLLIPIHSVERVDFTGTLGISEDLLRRTMVERFGATPNVGRAAEVARLLEQLYADHGFLAASIRPVSTELHDPDRTLLRFEIDAGPRTRIGRIVLSGEPQATHQQVLRALRVAPGEPYERVELQRRLTEYVERLRRRRYYQAAANHTATVADDQRTADLTIDIQSGPPVRLTFLGDPLPQNRTRELVPIEREGSVDEDLLEDSAQRIRDYLHSLGHWKGDVTVERRQAGEELEIVFTVRTGPVYRVTALELTGASAIPTAELRPLLGLEEGAVFVAGALDAAANAVRQAYRRRGFAWVDVKTAVTEVGLSGEGRVRPSITIVEGPRATVGQVSIAGAERVSAETLRQLITSRTGMPWFDPTAAGDRDAILLEYLNHGFAGVEVMATPVVSSDRSTVDLLFEIREGPQTLVDHILVVGNRRTDEALIRREILLRPGEPLGLQDFIESRRRLSALGLFRRVNITELAHGDARTRDLVITVEESPVTSLGYGGGLELTRTLAESPVGGEAEDQLELAPRGFFEIGRRNLGGKNRSVNFYTRVSLRPRDAPDDPSQDRQGYDFSEYRVVGTYREPRAFGWNADFTLLAAAEQGDRTSFDFSRKGIVVELLRTLTPTIRGSVRYAFGTTRTFDERLSESDQAAIDRLFPQVRLASFSGAVARDTRDDLLDPTRGAFLSAEGTLAARAFGGQVGFTKGYLQGAWFTRIRGTRGVVFATRAAAGLADGFPRLITPGEGEGGETPPPIVIEDIPASERFFAGGDSSIRGFILDRVGAPNTISPQGFPKGGNAVLILNAEARVPIWRDLGAALFVDGGNVFNRVTEFDFTELRGSTGFGVRYRSPIGPVRLDLGFNLDRRAIAGRLEPGSVLHFSIGQTF